MGTQKPCEAASEGLSFAHKAPALTAALFEDVNMGLLDPKQNCIEAVMHNQPGLVLSPTSAPWRLSWGTAPSLPG